MHSRLMTAGSYNMQTRQSSTRGTLTEAGPARRLLQVREAFCRALILLMASAGNQHARCNCPLSCKSSFSAFSAFPGRCDGVPTVTSLTFRSQSTIGCLKHEPACVVTGWFSTDDRPAQAEHKGYQRHIRAEDTLLTGQAKLTGDLTSLITAAACTNLLGLLCISL